LAVSTPAATLVASANAASAGWANPDSASEAEHCSDTLSGCHWPSGRSQVASGPVRSIRSSTIPGSETTPKLSTAVALTVVVPSLPTMRLALAAGSEVSARLRAPLAE
jgi:hypothetical protein